MRPRWNRHWVVGACVVLGAEADAAIVKVTKSGPIVTIQAGVDAAASGDTVVVGAGIYRETVDVPPNKVGLTVRAKGVVTIDALAPGGVPNGAAVQVAASHARLIGLRIQNARTDAIAGAGVGILVLANDVLIESCRVRSCDAGIFAPASDRVRVRKCRIDGVTGDGVWLTGIQSVVESTTILGTGGEALTIIGDGASIRKSFVGGAVDAGIRVVGDEFLVDLCVVVAVGPYPIQSPSAIRVVGDGGVVSRNRIEDHGAFGIACFGNGVEIRKNEIVRGDAPAIYLGSSTAYCLVLGNSVRDAAIVGVNSIVIQGSDHEVVQNVVRGAGCDAIRIDASASIVRDNDISGSAVDGIDVESGLGNVVIDNEVTDCAGEGIEVNAGGTVVTGNVAKSNRIDFATSAVLAQFSNNHSSDGTHVTPAPPELD